MFYKSTIIDLAWVPTKILIIFVSVDSLENSPNGNHEKILEANRFSFLHLSEVIQSTYSNPYPEQRSSFDSR